MHIAHIIFAQSITLSALPLSGPLPPSLTAARMSGRDSRALGCCLVRPSCLPFLHPKGGVLVIW